MNAEIIDKKLRKMFPNGLKTIDFVSENEVHLTFEITKLRNLNVESVKDMWNEWASEHGKPKVKVLSPLRTKGIKKAIQYYKEKEDWTQIFKGIESDSFWYRIMDFDKLYRNENFNKFYELGSILGQEAADPLEKFFNKYKDVQNDADSTINEDESGRKRNAPDGKTKVSVGDEFKLPQKP